MDNPRLDPRAARVVAWHNRHPLARRITAAQVQGIGTVAVPFFTPDDTAPSVAPGPGQLAAAAIGQAQASAAASLAHGPETEAEGVSLRERAAARAKQAAERTAGTGDGDGDDTLVADPAQPAGAAVPDAAPTLTPAAVAAAGAAAAKPGRLRAAFIEDFIAPISRRAAARFIARHGVALAAPPAGEPVREVAVAKASPGEAVVLLYAGTAAIEDGTRRVRVLLAPGATGPVLGPRLYDRRLIAALCVTLLSVAAAAGLALRPVAQAPAEPAAMAAAMSAPAPAPAPASALPAPAPAATPHEPPAAVAAPAPAPLASAAPVPEVPTPAAATAHATPPVHAKEHARPPASAPAAPAPRRDRRPPLDDAAKAAARQAVADLRASLPPAPVHAATPAQAHASGPAPAPPVAPATASKQATLPAAAHAAPAVPAAGQPLFALTSRVLRTEAESEQLATAARALLAQPAGKAKPLHVELMAAGADWRVVAWPFSSAAEAERARALLASRGLRVQVVGF